MTPRDFLLALMLVSTFAAALGFFRSRNWKGISVAGLATIGMFLAGSIAIPGAGLAQGVMWAAAMAILFTKPEWVAVASKADYNFIETYGEALARFRRPKEGTREAVDPGVFLAELQAALHTVESVETPSHWRSLREDTVGEMQSHLQRIRRLDNPSEDERAAIRQRWLALDRRFRGLVRTRAGFWAGLPGISGRRNS